MRQLQRVANGRRCITGSDTRVVGSGVIYQAPVASISSRYSSSTIVQLDASERGENPPEIIAIKNKARAVVGGGGGGESLP